LKFKPFEISDYIKERTNNNMAINQQEKYLHRISGSSGTGGSGPRIKRIVSESSGPRMKGGASGSSGTGGSGSGGPR
jgi:hypothetical protein